MRPHVSLFALCGLAATTIPVWAQAPSSDAVQMESAAASDERLDRLRGGADLGPDLHVSFGLQRLTTVNGTLVASTQFQVQDIAHLTPAEALAAQHVLGSLLTVANGQASSTALPAGNQSVATIIQNNLPNQVIKNVVTLNLTANSLSLLRAANAADQLRNLSLPGH